VTDLPPSPQTPSQRWLLAIDSSTDQAGVALFDGQRLAELTWTAGRTQTTSLLSEIDHLLNLQGVALGDIAAIAVATGPGAFSGLRVGFGIAKGLSLARGTHLLGVPTLDAAALPWSGQDAPVIAVVQAGRGRIVWAEYGRVDGVWRQTAPPLNSTPAELLDRGAEIASGATVTGELGDALVSDLTSLPGVTVPARSLRLRRPGSVAELAWERIARGEWDDPASLAPVYLHGR
jgi:tRNA threonylcarbamoyladenosine biosynthesis protein TsaB